MQKIIHCDFDCFYAAIETRDNPNLKGKPLAIGGSPENRGVIATCNYEARAFGIHSAMASSRAVHKCPQLILLKPSMSKYRQVSLQARQIFQRYSTLIEPLSLDEAFIDVSSSKAFRGSATLIAQDLRKRIKQELGITASAGIAPNKFLAKVASDWNKPDGQFVIEPKDIDTFVAALPVGKIFGVGKVTEKKMHYLGLHFCQDLRALTIPELTRHFGKFGERLYDLCRGIDTRPVNTQSTRKSISVENTYTPDIQKLPSALQKLSILEKELGLRFEKVNHKYKATGLFIKIKFSDFSVTTAEQTLLLRPEQNTLAQQLLQTALQRKTLPIRLLGIGYKLKSRDEENKQQTDFDFFDTE